MVLVLFPLSENIDHKLDVQKAFFIYELESTLKNRNRQTDLSIVAVIEVLICSDFNFDYFRFTQFSFHIYPLKS